MTTDHILVETWMLLSRRLGRDVAERFWGEPSPGSRCHRNRRSGRFGSGLANGLAWPDQDFSIVDRTSFAVMRRLGIERAASLDDHFAVFRFGPQTQRLHVFDRMDCLPIAGNAAGSPLPFYPDPAPDADNKSCSGTICLLRWPALHALRQPESGTALIMKPIRIVLAPTRSRPVNIFLGMVLVLVSLLLFLALATYHATDPSLNTATGPHASQLDRPLRRLPERPAAAGAGHHGVSASVLAGRRGLDVDALAARRFAHSALDGHAARAHFSACDLRPAALALALAARGSYRRRGGTADGRCAGGLPESARRMDGGCRAGRSRPLLCLGRQLRRDSRKPCRALGTFAEWREHRRDLREEEEELDARHSALQDEGNGAIPFSRFDAAANSEANAEIGEEIPAQKTNRFLAFFRRKRMPKQDPIDEIPAYQRADRLPEEAAQYERDGAANPLVMPRRTSIWERREAGTSREAESGIAAAAGTAATAMAAAQAAPAMFEPMRRQGAAMAPVDPWANEQGPASGPFWQPRRPGTMEKSRFTAAPMPRRTRDRGSQACERIQAARQHAAECRRRSADQSAKTSCAKKPRCW